MYTRHIFQKLFVLQFYRAHMGLFLFTALLLFGIVAPSQLIPLHISLSILACSSTWMALALLLLWGFYLLKCIAFIKKKLLEDSSSFLYHSATALDGKKLVNAWFGVLLMMGIPLGGYILLCLITGIYHGYVAVPLAMIVLMAILYLLALKHIDKQFKQHQKTAQHFFMLRLPGKWGKSYLFLGIRHLLSEQKLAFCISKLLSYLLVMGMFHVFHDLQDSMRMATLAIVAIVLANSMVLMGQFSFEQQSLAFMRNLPYGTWRKWFAILGRICLILLPEIAWIYARYPLADASLLACFLISFTLLVYHLLYFTGNNVDRFVKSLFFLFMAMVVIVPFGYTIALIAIFLLMCILVYKFKHHSA